MKTLKRTWSLGCLLAAGCVLATVNDAAASARADAEATKSYQEQVATRRSSRSVLDYYLMLPERYVSALKHVKDRRSIIEVQDIGNGYLKLGPWKLASVSGLRGWAEVALFKGTGGTDVIGVVDVGCGTSCSVDNMYFLQFPTGGTWTDVTGRVLPPITGEMLLAEYRRRKRKNDGDFENPSHMAILYELPRRGTTIKVKVDLRGKGEGGGMLTLFELHWNGEKFELSRSA